MNPANPQFVVVPREPTEAMLEAGAAAYFGKGVPLDGPTRLWMKTMVEVWHAMLAAAPSPDETLLIALLETQAMLETIDRTSSTNMQDVRRRIVLNRAALAAINAGDGEGR